jgi:hypothetical protein
VNLSKLNVTELRGYASDKSVELPPRLKSKEDIIAYIQKTLSDPDWLEKMERRKKLSLGVGNGNRR